MKTKIYLSLLFFAIILVSCKKNNNEDKSSNINFELIGKGSLSGSGDEGISQSNLVIKTSADWNNLMSQMNTVNNVTDDFTETNIDFNNYMLIAVFLEIKNHGWEVDISDIVENTNNIIVSKTEKQSDATVMSQPFVIVKIPKSNKPVIFN